MAGIDLISAIQAATNSAYEVAQNLSANPKLSFGSGGVRAQNITHAAPGSATTYYQPDGTLDNQPPPIPYLPGPGAVRGGLPNAIRGGNRFRVLEPSQGGGIDQAGMDFERGFFHTHYPVKVVNLPRFQPFWASDPEPWLTGYPDRRRDLLNYQRVQQYVVGNSMVAQRTWSPDNYFLGYANGG